MVVAQAAIATPIVVALVAAAVVQVDPDFLVQVRALGASWPRALGALVGEARLPLLAAAMAAFGAVVSEVGAAQMVGGNLAGETRVLATAAVLATSRGLRVTVGRREVLRVDALDVAAGETLAVLGPNGAGKSTLLRVLALLSPHRVTGQVLLDGRPATRAVARDAVAAVLQRPILRRGTVAANAASGLRLRGVHRAEAARRSAPWLDALGVGHLARRDARTLSGGEAQRVAIVRALAVEPRVLLLDEPFAGLDATTRTDLLADLRAVLDGLDTATLLVTHDPHEALALAGRTTLLVAGRSRQLGPTAEVLDRPADPDCARLVGFTNLVDGRAVRPERCRLCPPGTWAPTGGVGVPGVVRRIVPLGAGVRVDVTTAAGSWACLSGDPSDLTAGPGDAVVVTAQAADVRTLES